MQNVDDEIRVHDHVYAYDSKNLSQKINTQIIDIMIHIIVKFSYFAVVDIRLHEYYSVLLDNVRDSVNDQLLEMLRQLLHRNCVLRLYLHPVRL